MSQKKKELDEKERWSDIDKFIFRKGPFAHDSFNPGQGTKDFLQNICKVLIIGAGGLGCDLVKNLAMSGFRNIHMIDMDTIDLSNLNRQFLFRQKDVKKSKAVTAANFINRRVPGCNVTSHNCKIQDKDLEFYEQFHIVISGLDSISARRWINSTLVGMVQYEEDSDDEEEEGEEPKKEEDVVMKDKDEKKEKEVDFSTVKMFIDGGTEGFKGQARVITPKVSSCFECTMDLFPPQTTFPRCTIANHPRLPEHCIMYALEVLWPDDKNKKDIKEDETFDGDNVKHVTWVYEKALDRAKKHNIRGVTYRLTQGVVKNIIPAIASTNAVVASICANEALKLATLIATQMDDYTMYNGNEGIYTYTYRTDKKKTCYSCGTPPTIPFKVNDGTTLEDLVEKIKEHPAIRFNNPSIAGGDKGVIYNTKIDFFKDDSLASLPKTLKELKIVDGDELTIVDTEVIKDGGIVIQIIAE